MSGTFRPIVGALLATLAVLGCQPIEPPIADIRVEADPPPAVGAALALDGRGSRDPQDRPLVWRWRLLEAPPGSAARLRLEDAPVAQLTPDALGDYVVELIVGNGELTGAAERRITVGCIAPAVTVGASASAEGGPVGVAVELRAETTAEPPPAGCAVDAGVALRWRLAETPPGSRAALDDPTLARPQLVPDAPGAYVAEVRATDALGRVSTASVRYTAACGIAPPTIADLAAEPAAGFVGDPVRLTAEVRDPDAEPACGLAQPIARRWRFVERPAGSAAAIDDPGADAAWFTPDVEGDYTVELEVRDPQGNASTAVVAIAVSPCGARPPRIVALSSSPEAPSAGVPIVFAADVQDPDAEVDCGRFEAIRHAWRLDALPAGSRARLAPTDGLRPGLVPDVPGDYTVTLTATDETGRSATATHTVTVGRCGTRAPDVAEVAALPAAGPVGGPIALRAAVFDADVIGGCARAEDLRWRWHLVEQPAGSAAVIAPADAERPAFVPDVPGVYTAEVRVTDPTGRWGAGRASAEVSACGAGVPAVQLAADPPAPRTGERVRVAALIDDADTAAPCGRDEVFSVRWTFVESPAGFVPPAAPDRAALDFVPDAPGLYRLRAEVRDRDGHRGHAEIAVRAERCGAGRPGIVRVDAAPDPAVIGAPVALSALAADPDFAEGCAAEERLSWAWRFTALPAGAAPALRGAETARPSFVPDVAGDFTLEAVVTDARGLSAAAIRTITVDPCGSAAPQAAIDVAPAAPSVSAVVRFAARVDDADAACGVVEAFTYAWTLVDAPPGFDPADARLVGATPWLVATAPGRYALRLVVTDRAGHVGEARAEVEVAPCGAAAPVVEALAADPAPRTGQPSALSATVTDADADCGAPQAIDLRWQLVERPLGSLATLAALDRDAPILTPDVPGDYTVRVVARDATGRTSAPLDRTFTAADCGGRAPVIDALAVPVEPPVGADVALRVDARDPDADGDCGLGGPLTVAWRLLAIPPGSDAALTAADTFAPFFRADVAGRFAGDVTVTDADGATVRAAWAVDVGACGSHPPTIEAVDAPAGLVPVAEPVALAVTARDADADPPCALAGALLPAWRLVARPAGSAAQLDRPDTPTPSLTPDVPGTYRIEVTVADDTGRRSAPRLVEVVTEGACGVQPPIALLRRLEPPPVGAPTDRLGGASYACAGQPFALLDAGVSIEPDNADCGADQALTWAWRVRETPPGGAIDIRAPDRRVAGFVVDRGGRYVVEMDVTDDTGRRSGVATAAFDVIEVDPPVVEGIAPQFFCGDRDVTVTVTGRGFVEFDGRAPTVLVGDAEVPASALRGCVDVDADPRVRRCTALDFVLPADFPAGVLGVRVRNPFPVGCTSSEEATIVAAGAPRIDAVEPEPICRGQFEGQLVLTGDGFFQVQGLGLRPRVTVNGVPVAAPQLFGCRDLGLGLEACVEMRFAVPAGERDQPRLAIEVQNPPPADCEVGRFELVQSEPPRVDDVQPRKICDLGGFLDLTGAHFEPGMSVRLGPDRADAVQIAPDGTFARAIWDRGDEPRLDVGRFTLRATNASGCFTDFAEQIRVTEGPFVFFVDPPVVFNGTTLLATVYLGNLYGGSVERAVLTDPAGAALDVDFTFDPTRPNRIQIIVPAGLAPGRYDVTLYDDVDCPGTTLDLLTVTDTLTVALTGVTPRFGWAEGTTAVSIGAAAGAGFVPTPRAYLNPSAGDTCVDDAGCPADRGCHRGNCVATCLEVIDCLGGEACLDGRCVPQATELRGVVTLGEVELQGIVDAGRQPGDYDLVVVNPDGTVGLAERAFRITAEPPPVIDSVTPGSWITNEAALPIRIDGRDFRGATVSAECRSTGGLVGAPPITVVDVQPGTLTATVNTGAVEQLSVCVITVTNADGSTGAFSPVTTTNPAGNFVQFRAAAPLAVPRAHAPAVGGRPSRTSRFLYALGGEGADGAVRADGELSALDRFGEPGPWQPLPLDLPAGRSRTKAARVEDFVYLPGGLDGDTGAPTDTVLRALVLDPLFAPGIDNLDFEFSPDLPGLPTGVYTYRVAAVMAADDPANPGGETLAGDPQPVFIPDIPLGVIAMLDWPDFPGAAGYRVYRSVQADQTLGNERLVAELPAGESRFDDDGAIVPAGRAPLPVGALGEWHVVARLATARRGHGVTAAAIPGDPDGVALYAVGGFDAGGAALDTIDALRITVAGPRRQAVEARGLLATRLTVPRGRVEALTADQSNASVLPPGASVVYALSGDGANRANRRAEYAYVLADGTLGPSAITTDTQRARAGYAAAVANNNVVQAGGQNGAPSGTADKVPVCGAGCPDPAQFDNWSALGQTDLLPVVDMGRVVFDGFLYLVGGRFDDGVGARVQMSLLGGTP